MKTAAGAPLRFTLPSDPKYLPLVRAVVQEGASLAGFEEALTHRILLAVTEAVPTLLMRDVEDAPIAYDPETIVYRWFSRLVMLGLLALGLYLIHQAWVRKAVVAGASPGTDPGSTES